MNNKPQHAAGNCACEPCSAPGGATGSQAASRASIDRQDLLLQGLQLLEQSYCQYRDNRQFFEELRQLEAEARDIAEKLNRPIDSHEIIKTLIGDIRQVDEIIQKYDSKKSALIQILLEIQKTMHWLPGHTLKWISARLDIPYARIYSLAHFYEAYSLEPRGAHQVQVCMGTACHVQGAPRLMEKVSSLLQIKPGETDAEQRYTLESVYCMGCCALGPVIKIDDKYFSDPRVTDLKKIVKTHRQEDNRE